MDTLAAMDYEQALATLRSWAEADANVRALVMTGSGGAGKVHPLSDRDIEIYATDVDALLADESWWSGLGDVLVVERLQNDDGYPTRLVYYVGGKLDFALIPASRLEGTMYKRPYMMLLDKDDQSASLRLTAPRWTRPTESEFMTSVNWAYAAALMCAKAAMRDELWAAKLRDRDLKDQLLQMIEWDHRARYGDEYDTHYLGTRMNEWMDEDIREQLSSCWGHFDAVDTAVALRSTVLLFFTVSSRTAAKWRFPSFNHARVHAEIEAILAGASLPQRRG